MENHDDRRFEMSPAEFAACVAGVVRMIQALQRGMDQTSAALIELSSRLELEISNRKETKK